MPRVFRHYGCCMKSSVSQTCKRACFVITWSLFYILDYGRTDNFDRAINEFKKGYQLGKLC